MDNRGTDNQGCTVHCTQYTTQDCGCHFVGTDRLLLSAFVLYITYLTLHSGISLSFVCKVPYGFNIVFYVLSKIMDKTIYPKTYKRPFFLLQKCMSHTPDESCDSEMSEEEIIGVSFICSVHAIIMLIIILKT